MTSDQQYDEVKFDQRKLKYIRIHNAMDAANRAIFRHDVEAWMDALLILKLEVYAYFKHQEEYTKIFNEAYSCVYSPEFAQMRNARRQGMKLSTPLKELEYSRVFQKAHSCLVKLHQETTKQMKESLMELPIDKNSGPGRHFFKE